MVKQKKYEKVRDDEAYNVYIFQLLLTILIIVVEIIQLYRVEINFVVGVSLMFFNLMIGAIISRIIRNIRDIKTYFVEVKE